MSHHIYTTKGVVLSLHPHRESDKVATLFTRELGLVYGEARGIRKLGSKLTTTLIDLSLVKVSLVRGRRLWRVTTVSTIRDVAGELRERWSSLVTLINVLTLLRKLVRGEEKNQNLYDKLEESITEILDEQFDQDELRDWELHTVSGILSQLGYLDRSEVPKSKNGVKLKRRGLLNLVNQGIRESGLE